MDGRDRTDDWTVDRDIRDVDKDDGRDRTDGDGLMSLSLSTVQSSCPVPSVHPSQSLRSKKESLRSKRESLRSLLERSDCLSGWGRRTGHGHDDWTVDRDISGGPGGAGVASSSSSSSSSRRSRSSSSSSSPSSSTRLVVRLVVVLGVLLLLVGKP